MKDSFIISTSLTCTIGLQASFLQRITHRQSIAFDFPQKMPELWGTLYIPNALFPAEIFRGSGVTCSFERAYPDLVVYSPDFSGSQALSSCIPSALGTRRLIMSSYWGRRVRTEREFHSAKSGEIRSETLRSWRFSGAGPIGQRCSVVDSQLSSHTFIFRPPPTIHPTPLLMISLPARIPLHP